MADDACARLRATCLALPEAAEVAMKRDPTYRVGGRIFAMDRPLDGAPAVWCKPPPCSQGAQVGDDPGRFFVPPYVGPKGWVGMRLDGGADWDGDRDRALAPVSPPKTDNCRAYQVVVSYPK